MGSGEDRAAEPQMDVRLFHIVAQAARSFLGSVDHILPASECRVVAAREAVEVFRFGFGQQLKFEVQAGRIRVLRVAGSSVTSVGVPCSKLLRSIPSSAERRVISSRNVTMSSFLRSASKAVQRASPCSSGFRVKMAACC